MKALAAIAVAGAVALAAVAGSGASSKRLIELELGDTVDVRGTQILCTVQKGTRRLLKGKTLVGCVKVAGNAPKVGSYAVAIGTNGTVEMARVQRDGRPRIVYERTLSRVGAVGGRVVTVRAGDVMLLGGSDLACAVNASSGGLTTSCFLFRGNKTVPRSYAVGITDGYSFVSRFDAKGRSKTVFVRQNP